MTFELLNLNGDFVVLTNSRNRQPTKPTQPPVVKVALPIIQQSGSSASSTTTNPLPVTNSQSSSSSGSSSSSNPTTPSQSSASSSSSSTSSTQTSSSSSSSSSSKSPSNEKAPTRTSTSSSSPSSPATPVIKTPAPNEPPKIPEPQEAPANQTPHKPTDAEVAQVQKMLHMSVTEYRYFGTATGCCAKIARIFKAIMFFIFGRFGYCLGTAQDEKVGIKMENLHISGYEKALDEIVASLPREKEVLDRTKFDPKLMDLYTAYKGRQEDVVMLNMLQPQVWRAMHHGVLADLKAKIEKHNQKNPTKQIDAERCLQEIQKGFDFLETATVKKRADGYLGWYAQFITPERIAKDGLKIVAEFADHYCKFYGETLLLKEERGALTHETSKNRAALRLRTEIETHADCETQRTVFSKALSALSRKKDGNKEELATLTAFFSYFDGTLKGQDQAGFLTAVFAPKAQKTVK